jgi:hypothetical protein
MGDTDEHKKSKNIFLTKNKDNYKDKYKSNENNNKLKTNIFANEIGKQVKEVPKREINVNDEELFPSLTDNINVKQNKKSNTISYVSVAKREKMTPNKELAYDVEPGWVHLFRENGKTHILYGPTTLPCLEIERNRIKKENDDLKKYLDELEEERNLRKELYGDIIEYYDPMKDRFYTKEENIVIYGLDELSDSDSESLQEYGDCDFENGKQFDNDR